MKLIAKYVLHPNFVRSKTDGDEHYITSKMLTQLYRVDPRECVDYPRTADELERWEEPKGAIHLWPRRDGNYVPPWMPPIKLDESIPPGEIWFVQNDEVVGRIINAQSIP